MLILDLKRVFHEKEIDNPHQFLKKLGVPMYASHRLLHNELNSISFKYLEIICLHLNCTVDDLISWTPDSKRAELKNHPLNKLRRTQSKERISNKIKDLSLDKLDQVRNFIAGLEETH